MRSRLLAILILVSLSLSAQAAILTVASDGTGDYPTIQAAIDAANNSDIISLLPGVYTGPGNRDLELDFALTLQSADSADPAIIDCQGSPGAAHRALIVWAGSVTLNHVVIRNGYNTLGGGVLVDGGTLTLDNCRLENCTSTQGGGAMAIDGGDLLTANNCVLVGNTASVEGGAVYAGADTEVRLYNCTVFGNEAPDGSSLFTTTNALARINSTIMASGIGGAPVSDYYGGGFIIGCTNIFGNQGGDWVGSLSGQDGLNNNVSVDPVFCDEAQSDLTLHFTSPCAPENSPCGLIGALPVGCQERTIYLASDGSGDYPTIQAALDAAHPFDTIELGPGNFTGAGNRGAVIDKNDIRLFAPGEDAWIDGQSEAGPPALTIEADGVEITGLGISRCVASTVDSLAGVVIRNADPVFNNLRVEFCNSMNVWGYGGGMRLINASPTMNGGRFFRCYADRGGAVYTSGESSPVFNGVLFQQTEAINLGGAFFVNGGSPVFNDCEFRTCSSEADGGAGVIAHHNGIGNASFFGCGFFDNLAGGSGGAVEVVAIGASNFSNCVFMKNRAIVKGGALSTNQDSQVQISQCTMFLNSGNGQGGHIFNRFNSTLTITNSILAWARSGGAIQQELGATATLTCSDLFGNRGGDWIGDIAGQFGLDGNISADPMFLDPYDEDINIHPLSPCGPFINPGCGAIGAGLSVPGRPHYLVGLGDFGMLSTIQAALDMVPENSVIELMAFTYTGDGNRDLNFNGKDVELTSYNQDPSITIIDAQGSASDPHRVAYLHNGEPQSTKISNVTLRGGFTSIDASHPYPGNGGAILMTNGSSLALENVIFGENTGVLGSAIEANSTAGHLTVTNCTFNDCNDGGTILQTSGRSLVMANSQTCGGGVSVNNASNVMEEVTITNCNIQSPGSSAFSAYFLETTPVTISGSNFVSAVFHGNVFLECLNVNIQNSTFQFDPSQQNEGSIVYSFSSSLQFNNCDFSPLVGSSPGFCRGLDLEDSVVSLQLCNFTDCLSPDNGGGLRAVNSTVTLAESTFQNNSSDLLGGGAYFETSTVEILESTFAGNTAQDGGGFYGDRCNLTVDGSHFDGNSDGLRHHGSSLQGLSVTNTTFTGHTGGWAAEVDSMLIRPVLFEGCTFSNNVQGLRMLTLPEFRIANSTFDQNPGNRTVVASQSSGAIDTCGFTFNTATSEGGALYMLGSDVSLTGSAFADNSSALTGGAVQVQSGSADFHSCTFDRNHATEHGGALAAIDATLVLDDCVLLENSADQTGGALYTFEATTTVNQSIFNGGQAQSLGGSAYHRYGTTQYTGSRISSNTAGQGGGLASASGDLTLNDVEIMNNEAANAAGGVNVFDGNLTMTGGAVSVNTTSQFGGIYLYNNSTGQINGSLITRNTSGTKGSGITVANNSTLDLYGCTIAGNGGVGSLGQMYAELDAAITLEAAIVAFSEHGPAAAVADPGSAISLTYSDVYGNSAGDWTGALAGQENQVCNFSLDPLFCELDLGDYHLSTNSPCTAGYNPCGTEVGALGEGCAAVSPVQESELPTHFTVLGNHPNPFNPRTDIAFEIPVVSAVVVEIYDVTGRRVRQLITGDSYPAGRHQVTWDGTDDQGRAQSSGLYLYRVQADGQVQGGKMALIR